MPHSQKQEKGLRKRVVKEILGKVPLEEGLPPRLERRGEGRGRKGY